MSIYFIYYNRVVNLLPPLMSILVSMFFSIVNLLIIGPLMFDDFTLGTDPKTGAFGFLTYGDLLYAFVYLGFIAGFCTFSLIGYIVKILSPLVLCTAYLFEPLIAQITACILGLDKVPGWITIFGAMITLIGIFEVGVGAHLKKQ